MSMLFVKRYSIYALSLVSLSACEKNYDNVNLGNGSSVAYVYDWSKIADSSTTALISGYWDASGSYFNDNNQGNVGFNYWPQAHALDVLVDAYLRTQSATYTGYMSQWYTGVQAHNGGSFIGQFYDDMGWNALAMLRTYDATNNAQWKTAVETVWANIQTGWNTIEGGGIAWQKNELYYKNTPANGPACILAARLYQQFGNASDMAWAQQIYTWEKSTLVDPGTGFVYDGINGNDDGKLDVTDAFTYDQGLFIGAALEMYNMTGQTVYLDDAVKTANNAITSPILAPSGILRDEGQGDGGLFKGVFVRYLVLLAQNKNLDAGTQQKYVLFLENNAESLWLQGTTRPGLFYGSNWTAAPSGETDLTTELSGAILMEGVEVLKKAGLF
jgi:predicted alpha-1,6-mannanase (GH76 family)